MAYGGIFEGSNSLGTYTHAMGESGGGGGGLSIPCVGQDFVKAIQLKLNTLGYKIPIDGIWTQCTASAWLKENGNQPLAHKDQVKSFLGVECSSGYIDPSGLMSPGPWSTTLPYCTDGSDAKNTGGGGGGGGGTTVQPPEVLTCLSDCASKHAPFTPDAFACASKCTGYALPPGTPPGPGTTTPAKVPPGSPPGTTAGISTGTYALIAVGVVAIGAIAYYATKKKAPEGLKQNRHRRYVKNCRYC